MLWFLLIVGLLIFAPGFLLLVGVSVVAVVIPFIVFFAVWASCIFVIVSIWPNGFIAAIAIGFVAGIVAARTLVKRTLET